MAAQLQIFMTNPASHTDCKGMWNLCVNLAVVVVVVVVKKKTIYSVECRHCCGGHVRFDKESHGSSIHPDLNMSEFSRLAKGKSFLGKVVRFFYSLTLRRMGRRAPFYEGSPKNNYQLHSIIGVARHLWRRCLSFCGKWKLWHRWPKYLSHGNRAFSEKRRKHFPTFSLLSLLDSLTHTSHGRGR